MNRFLLSACILSLGIASCKSNDDPAEPKVFKCPSDPATVISFTGEGTPWNGPAHLVVPNAFSPNGDGKNDVFRLVLSDSLGVCDSAFVRISDYNGKLVKTLHSPYQTWDGIESSTGNYSPAGYYTLDYSIHMLSKAQTYFKTGLVCLKLYRSDSASNCLKALDDSKYDVFENQINPKTGEIVATQSESYCPR